MPPETFKMVKKDDNEEFLITPEVAVVREIYEGENAQETFELELERALEAAVPIIVIEPMRLGDETARWIAVGNCLHKTAVLSGLGALITGFLWNERPYICTPFGVMSVFCTSLYTISWQFDPCCKYQVEHDTRRLAKLPLQGLGSSSPIVLVRRDDKRRKALHCTISLLAAVLCAWRVFQACK